ncbi:glycosyltransferase family 4 protein [Nodosilinea nodulosa]|uniref:glycosyltransferase family 4 protein n=1 Tax=Nodosilinea nodulosa TaxID=416001 RepID=UPI00036DF14E|nr:glycosyltransferase family 4 protein [Nodosilinea nodulosa]
MAKFGISSEGIEGKRVYLPQEINSREAELLHIHWLHEFYSESSTLKAFRPLIKYVLGLTVIKLRGIKVVWTAHNIKDHDDREPLLDRICTLVTVILANAIIVHSEAAKKELVAQFPFNISRRVHVIPHANYIGQYKNSVSRQEARQRLNIPESKFVFLFLGLIRPYKGVTELIDAFEKLNHPEAHLVIAGKSKDKALLETIQQRAEANPSIDFIPDFVPDDDVQVYMNAADVAVFPYRQILTSGAVLLAMSFGRACLAPKKDCITEVLTEQGSFLYEPAQRDGLFLALQSALRQQETIAARGEYNYKMAQAWDWDDVAKKTVEVYRACFGA